MRKVSFKVTGLRGNSISKFVPILSEGRLCDLTRHETKKHHHARLEAFYCNWCIRGMTVNKVFQVHFICLSHNPVNLGEPRRKFDHRFACALHVCLKSSPWQFISELTKPKEPITTAYPTWNELSMIQSHS